MSNQKEAKQAIQLPLIGLALAWLFFMAAIWANLYLPFPEYDRNGQLLTEPQVEPGTYLFLAGITAFAIFALLGQRKALALRTADDFPLAKTAHRFSNLAVIIGLAAGAVFAIGNFLGAFNRYDSRDASALVRIFGVYVPIVLATVLVVLLILFAFVFRKDAPDLRGEEKDEERARLQRYVGLAYASPIIGTAIAIILGLVVYDVTRTDLDVWIWVVIQAIIATSILLGTSFAAKVRLSRPLAPKVRQTGVAAVNLNLVLTIVFGVVVVGMSFSFGASAIEELRNWPQYAPVPDPGVQQPVIVLPSLNWFFSKMLPAIALLALAEVGLYRSMVVRSADKEELA
jgi:hypothetical protein